MKEVFIGFMSALVLSTFVIAVATLAKVGNIESNTKKMLEKIDNHAEKEEMYGYDPDKMPCQQLDTMDGVLKCRDKK